jgi:hypothetical protein
MSETARQTRILQQQLEYQRDNLKALHLLERNTAEANQILKEAT